jgi:hypothetical protein
LGKPTAIQARVDMFNALNFIDNRLGIADIINNNNPLEFRGVVTDATGSRPRFRVASAVSSVNSAGQLNLSPTLRQGAGLQDVWNLQFGVRITLN